MQILKKIKNNSDYKRLFENFISLSILQGLNYILPLVTFPYLVRVLGVEKFGLLSFATATIAYFQILTDYGFNLSATREVAIYRDNKEKLQEIFSSVMIIKFGLLLVSLILLSIVVFSFNKFRQDWLVYYLSFGMVLGQVLFPVWFFQGMERMRYITLLNILAKGLFTVAIFVFVRTQEDYWKVPLLNSIGFLIAGVVSLWIVYRYWAIRVQPVSKASIVNQLREGWHIFVANLTGNIYGQGTIFILGLLKDNAVVGYYSIAEKLLKAISGLVQPLAQTIYPYLARKNIFKIKNVLQKTYKTILILNSILLLILVLGVKYVYYFFVGKVAFEISLTYYVLSTAIFFTILNVLKQPLIYILKKDLENSKMYIFVGVSFIPICFLLTYSFAAIGTAISLLYVEVSIFILGIKIIINGFNGFNGERYIYRG